jgi:HSP20 family protein
VSSKTCASAWIGSPTACGARGPTVPTGPTEGVWSPRVDIEETDDAWIVKAELPGVQRDNVTVEVRDGDLRITGKLDEDEQREGTVRQRMRKMGRFEYRTTLPEVDA